MEFIYIVGALITTFWIVPKYEEIKKHILDETAETYTIDNISDDIATMLVIVSWVILWFIPYTYLMYEKFRDEIQ